MTLDDFLLECPVDPLLLRDMLRHIIVPSQWVKPKPKPMPRRTRVNGRTNEIKKRMLQMAADGLPKPLERDDAAFYSRFLAYTRKGCRVYDANFMQTLKQMRPDWFTNKQTNDRLLEQEKILEMARSGAEQPKWKNPLYETIMRWKVDYPEFREKLKTARPDWFDLRAAQDARKAAGKKEMLELAKNGRPRPAHHYKLIHWLRSDPVFKSDLMKVNPSWFRVRDVGIKRRFVG